MGAVTDAVTNFVGGALCAARALGLGFYTALAGLVEGEPIRGLDSLEYALSDVCGTKPTPPSQIGLPPSSLFDQGPGWYVFTKGRSIDIFTCARGAEGDAIGRFFFSNSYTSVTRGADKRRANGPCQWTFGALLSLTRASGAVQEGSADSPYGPDSELTSLEIIRWDGGSGYDRYAPPPPPGWQNFGGPITVSPPGKPSFTIPLAGVFAPVTINLDGTINIPVKVDVGGVKISLNYNSGNSTWTVKPDNPARDYRPGDKPGDLVTDPFSPIPPATPADRLPPGFTSNPPSGLESEDVIVGVVVAVSAIRGGLTQVPQSANPDLWLPDLGVVAFATRVNGSDYAWSNPVRVQGRRQYIECPLTAGAVAVAGTPRVGVSWTLRPVYAQKNTRRVGGGL